MSGYGMRGARLVLAAVLWTTVSGVSLVQAQQAAARQFSFDIPAKSVPQAVNDIGRVTGLAVVFRENRNMAVSAKPVRGSMTAEQALSTLLDGTGLSYRFSNNRTIQIYDPAAAPDIGDAATDATTLKPIVVQAGTATTEGSGSYRAETVTIGKMARSLREIPNSVTVVTREQIDDQDLNSVQDVIGATNGATLIKNDDVNERTELQFRGFVASSLQVDGSSMSANNDVTTFDTAIYDRVEVLKGPAGILQGAREPGGTINLVRKKPTDERQIKIDGEVGSWNQRRVDADISGPLTDDGGIRGRIVGAWDKGDSFIDLVNYDRRLLYGALDFDITDRTTLTLGGAWQEGDGRNSRGLPAYADGTLLDVPRSTYAGADWDRSRTRSTDVFAKLEHEFEGGALWDFSANYLDRKRDGKIAFANAAVDPATGLTELLPEHRMDREDNLNLDTSVSIPFDVGGQEQKVVLGADYHKATEQMDRARGDEVPLDIFDPDYGIPEPDFEFNRFEQVKSRQYGVYGQAQIKPVEWGTIIAGGRLSWWETQSSDRQTGEETSRASIDAEFTPYVAGIIDITDTTSIYASYASIFVPQDAVTRDNQVIDPREGKQYEVGVKTELFDGAANASFALFQIEDRNRAVTDPADEDYSLPSGKARSRGFEVDVSGELLPSWNVTAGYTYLTSKYLEDPDNSGGVFEPRAPRHSFRLWNKYTVPTGRLEGLSIGGGIRAFTDVYRIDEGARFSQPGYAVVDLQLGYRFNDNLKASLTVTNVFDKTYYQSVGYGERQNYYGEPRAVTFKLSSTF
ncbi:TonB-dependent siderophore receptor [Agrobacterium sp. Ap1]|uniref:TonB-dependent siderophore receptor n=1 Tax=Agrobacterium sp. Ap1 TaxID=2815337 RepID=UPI001A8F8F55|nr:TonB-dependent receptor [Agrobacterium sp. Ap1]MBO0144703.1 TonB-dependent siderophore receptor [Agrobacterium sp. Ap1]